MCNEERLVHWIVYIYASKIPMGQQNGDHIFRSGTSSKAVLNSEQVMNVHNVWTRKHIINCFPLIILALAAASLDLKVSAINTEKIHSNLHLLYRKLSSFVPLVYQRIPLKWSNSSSTATRDAYTHYQKRRSALANSIKHIYTENWYKRCHFLIRKYAVARGP